MAVSAIKTSMSSGPIMGSMALHILVMAMFMIGTPYIRDDVSYEQPVAVEIATIDKITQTNRAPLNAPKPEKAPKKPKPPAPKTEPIKAAPPPPKPVAPIKKPVKPVKPDVKEEVATIKEPEKLEPLPPPVDPPKPEQIEKVEPDTTSIDNLLTSLVGAEEQVLKDLTPPEETAEEAPEPAPNISRITDRLTISEQDALRYQLSQCWNVDAGIRNADDLVVQVRLTMNPDRTVRTAQLVDNGRYNRDTLYRSAADRAMRAVRNPRCSPLQLPADKFEEWKTIVVRFDPRDMF